MEANDFTNAKKGDIVWFGLQQGIISDINSRSIAVDVFIKEKGYLSTLFFTTTGCLMMQYVITCEPQLFNRKPTF